jgi:predicted hotdog family 3-hydroxylacyl-ACP dehydratase
MIAIGELLPHRGTARMIDRVVSLDDTQIVVATSSHRAPSNPLLFEGRLASVHLVEYGAQAMALHGALRAIAAGGIPKNALLVAVRDFSASRSHVEDLAGELEIRARELISTAAGWQYLFEVRHDGSLIASGRVAAIASGEQQRLAP